MENKYPAPWNLTGKGYILLYKFNKDFVNEHGNLPDFLKGRFTGGLGAVMLVDYISSDAGPYGELLFIPGKFRHHGKKQNCISKIYVSTMASVENGIRNWAIPKENAAFEFHSIGKSIERISIFKNGISVAEFTFKSGGFSFPVNTKLLPFPLVQKLDGKYYYTTFSGKGKGKPAHLKDIRINPELFPDVSIFRPLGVIRVDPFRISFPEAVIEHE